MKQPPASQGAPGALFAKLRMYCTGRIRDGRASLRRWREPGLKVRSICDFPREAAGIIHLKG